MEIINMPKIIVLDGYTMNPGDLSWAELENLCECKIYARTPPELIIERIDDAELVLVNKVAMTREIMAQLPKLKYIGVLATGYNVVDIAAANDHGITVTNIPAYSTDSVAQTVFSHLLNLSQQVAHHAQTVTTGKWSKCPDFSYSDTPQIELCGLTLGIIGCGKIGRRTAEIGRAFGMKIIGCTRTIRENDDIEMVSMKELFERADVVSLHCPLTADNEHMVNAEMLTLMKPTAFLINTGRGPLIDEDALADALNNGIIAGAGLDVLSSEPPNADNPLLTAKNCFITPHLAWATAAARKRLYATAVVNLDKFIRGNPQNVVS
jgi:glycerate dehydrogenase